jgi:RNA polymerase sigma-70 factor (ECF subfamily)
MTQASTHESEVERFTRLLAKWQRHLFIYAMGLLHDTNDAEEVLQETSVVLWRKFGQYQPGTDFRRWACRVAYYEVLKLRKRKARRELLLSNEFVEKLASESDRAMGELDARRDALKTCLGKLNPGDRELVKRRYQPGATTRSVAEESRRSVQGTKKTLHRIRSRLLACIRRTLVAGDHP